MPESYASSPRSIRAADYVNFHLGGHALRARLNRIGWSNEKIKEQHLAYLETPDLVIQFMGGREIYELLPGEWREPMLALSALRMLCEDAGVMFAARRVPDEDRVPSKAGDVVVGAFGDA